MNVAILIPTRGRPELLRETVKTISHNCAFADTKIVLGFDGDDETIHFDDPRVIHTLAPREDTMGAKWNRLWRAAWSDLYVMGCDDNRITSFGWDKRLVDAFTETFTDGIGFAYFGKHPVPSAFPGCLLATSQKTIRLMGKLAPEIFPFWWIDTWLWEIAMLIERVIVIDHRMHVETPHHEGQSRGVRDVDFWAAVFDQMRPEREAIAKGIVTSQWFDRDLAIKLRADALRPHFEHANAFLRDPERARSVERGLSFDAPTDERYLRAKAKAEALMNGQKAA